MERSVNSNSANRNHAVYWAFLMHRISGVVLALFLPIHFYMLSMSVTNAAKFDSFISWTEMPLVKFAEAGLVVLLTLHLTGGLRLLALEFLPWRDWQKSVVALACGLSLIIGLVFLLNGT
jgi:fumarate reductase subunit D